MATAEQAAIHGVIQIVSGNESLAAWLGTDANRQLRIYAHQAPPPEVLTSPWRCIVVRTVGATVERAFSTTVGEVVQLETQLAVSGDEENGMTALTYGDGLLKAALDDTVVEEVDDVWSLARLRCTSHANLQQGDEMQLMATRQWVAYMFR